MILSKAYLGSTEITKAYLNDALVLGSTFGGLFEYKLNGNTTETTGNHQGTLTGTLTYVTHPDGVKQAARFTGTQYIDIPSSADFSVSNFTMAMWLRDPSFESGFQTIFEHGRLEDGWYGLFKSSAADGSLNKRWANGGGSTSRTGTPVQTANEWAHFIYSVNGTRIEFYKDGVLVDFQNSITLNTPTLSGIRIGTNQSGGEGLSMDIANLQFWNTGKDSTEIAEIYANRNL